MKLSFKIFLGICIPAIIAIVIISSILITRSFSRNIDSETERCIEEFKLIEMNIENAFNSSTSEAKNIIKAYSDYYNNKGIKFAYYEDGKEVYKSEEFISISNNEILDVTRKNLLASIENMQGEYYVLVSTKLSNEQVLIYIRNINSIYEIKDDLIILSTMLIIIILAIVSGIAYIISKTLTKPLNKMQKEMLKLSNGEYDINLKEGRDELGILAKNFNQMSKELEHRNNELVEMVNSKQVFIDNLSHEINTPLTSILGYAQLLEKANCTEEQTLKFLTNIQADTKRIKDIHNKLLLLSYKKNSDFEEKTLDMEDIFTKVKASIYFKLEERKINLIIKNLIKEIYGDETLIIMCVSNLISNAINASKEGSNIIVNAYEDENKKYIQVIDEGQGISKENIEKIVEPFYRVDKARSRKNGGAGLGLTICKNIMELHKGCLKIESEIGKGSIFILEFPQK